MKRMVGEFLRLVCETCAAERARIRVSFEDGDRPLLVVERAVEGGASLTRGEGRNSAQMSLLDLPAAAAEAPVAHEAREIAPPAALDAAEWEPAERNGLREWRFRGAVNGFRVELDLELGDAGTAFVNDRVAAALPYLPFLGSIFDAERSPLPSSGNTGWSSASFDPPLLGDSPCMIELKRVVRRVSASDVSVLIEGESGTGKEVVARNLHRLSPRRAKPLVISSCLEMPRTLLQSELFGHAEGAFTGASRDRAGLIESAGGGTFFLDEIGEMPLSLQATLLRVLQEREIRRIGESRRRRVDVRFVFATNRDLDELVKRGRFRQDLYFRISAVRLRLPPLRQRKGDIAALANRFLAGFGGADAPPDLSFGAMRRLLAYHWPGNVRELKNEMERFLALHPGERMIAPEMLSPHVVETSGGPVGALGGGRGALPGAVQDLERRMIESALDRFSGNKTRAAESLGITRQGLLKKLKRYRVS